MDEIYCFGGNPLDRVSERRDDHAWIATLLSAPETRILPLRDLKPFTHSTAPPALDWQPVAQWREHVDTGATLIFLGVGDGRAHFALDASAAHVAPDVDTELIERLGGNDPCPCGSGRRFPALLPSERPI